MNDIKIFGYLDLETIGKCNRRCPTCIRNSHPNKFEIGSWFSGTLLSMEIIKEALDQCKELGFTGGVCLSHYNEPLMDDRIADIAKFVRSYHQFHPIFLNTNGDLLTRELAASLDGALDHIIITLYTDRSVRHDRAVWLTSLFSKTRVDVATMSEHIPTHFSPKFDVVKLAKSFQDRPCGETTIRVIINHRRQFLLCCDDVIGNFDLGTFPETSIKDYWFGNKHSAISNNLSYIGGRKEYEYCRTCPRA